MTRIFGKWRIHVIANNLSFHVLCFLFALTFSGSGSESENGTELKFQINLIHNSNLNNFLYIFYFYFLSCLCATVCDLRPIALKMKSVKFLIV